MIIVRNMCYCPHEIYIYIKYPFPRPFQLLCFTTKIAHGDINLTNVTNADANQ